MTGPDTSLREKALRDEIPTWRCFHCDEVFHTRHAAQMHFGYTECSEPACRIKAGAEGSILEALRRAENDAELAIAAMHDESSEGWRAYHSIAGRVREQVDAAENLGYERGIRDEREAKDRRIEALEAALTELAEYVDGYHFASERGRVARLVFSARAALSGKEGQS